MSVWLRSAKGGSTSTIMYWHMNLPGTATTAEVAARPRPGQGQLRTSMSCCSSPSGPVRRVRSDDLAAFKLAVPGREGKMSYVSTSGTWVRRSLSTLGSYLRAHAGKTAVSYTRVLTFPKGTRGGGRSWSRTLADARRRSRPALPRPRPSKLRCRRYRSTWRFA